ncbi:thiolase family protein [Thermomonas sp.]|jgi:acetyl-CoA acyltransferase|uniref:thiolase family protein n=1 Tax=Thermomonas sp. TaxID=1971895 RepID=UPI001B4E24F7|nr:thiolase family protein [Thermomonas sp.]HQW64279.1 thiolase family protein [Pseudomonadota bacterium]MBK6332683.1 thiolase family protein [Thermomonas sp.]MBK6416331.1 thiolase family protein [Thermomonas sp.]MBK6925069.1 thiolase family protein [Thermomonas sp.]MBL0227756.1 thiolase family protein [Thermomonas sp.]
MTALPPPASTPTARIVAARRTPIGRSHADSGALRDMRADELLARLIAEVTRTLPDAGALDDVLVGCVGQHLEQGKNIARLASLLAGLPASVPGVTFNRLCASSLEAFNTASMRIAGGQDQLLLAGGIEHMQHVPMAAAVDYHPDLLARPPFPFNNMGLAAEWLAVRDGIGRATQDAWALESHRRACHARAHGRFRREMLAIDGIADDQCPRADASRDALAALRPAFREDGSVTAGNASPLSDGASLVLLASAQACVRDGLRARAEVLGSVVVGLAPEAMGDGPVLAIRKLLARFGLATGDIDRYEINEAFAAQVVSNVRALALVAERVNPDGGAIALGHPLGATGTRLVTTLLHGLEADDGELGIAALCVGHGQGVATLIRRLH